MQDLLQEIEDYIRRNPGCTTSEIARALGIDIITAEIALNELSRQGRIEGEPTGKLIFVVEELGLEDIVRRFKRWR